MGVLGLSRLGGGGELNVGAELTGGGESAGTILISHAAMTLPVVWIRWIGSTWEVHVYITGGRGCLDAYQAAAGGGSACEDEG